MSANFDSERSPLRWRGSASEPPTVHHQERSVEARPRATKFHAAPCQSPPMSIVRNRFTLGAGGDRCGCRRVGCTGSRAARRRALMCQRCQNSAGSCAKIRRAEVLHQLDSEQQRAEPARHVGVAREIEVDLECEGVQTPEERPGGVLVRGFGEHRIRYRFRARRRADFRNQPEANRKAACSMSTSVARTRRSAVSCGSSLPARSIGPATSCGKKLT